MGHTFPPFRTIYLEKKDVIMTRQEREDKILEAIKRFNEIEAIVNRRNELTRKQKQYNMKTRVTVLGQTPNEKELEPIQLISGMNETGKLKLTAGIRDLKQFNEVVLLEKHYFDNGDDLIFCKHDDPELSCLFRGSWNDGVIFKLSPKNKESTHVIQSFNWTVDNRYNLPKEQKFIF